MSKPLFTVLLSSNRPPALLPYAVESVLAQEEHDFELFIICDGAPPETANLANQYAARDGRIRVFGFDKGRNQGEAHREAVLVHARSRFVAQIGEDDLWFPGYLRELAKLLQDVDFAIWSKPRSTGMAQSGPSRAVSAIQRRAGACSRQGGTSSGRHSGPTGSKLITI